MTKMRVVGMLVGFAAALASSGCATPLNSVQKAELRSYQAKGLVVQEKNPSTGAALGLLPGGGSFYARETGLGVVNLLFWPASILWDPVSGYEGSQAINYYTTRVMVDRKMKAELKDLEDSLASGSIDNATYFKAKKEIEQKYAAEI